MQLVQGSEEAVTADVRRLLLRLVAKQQVACVGGRVAAAVLLAQAVFEGAPVATARPDALATHVILIPSLVAVHDRVQVSEAGGTASRLHATHDGACRYRT